MALCKETLICAALYKGKPQCLHCQVKGAAEGAAHHQVSSHRKSQRAVTLYLSGLRNLNKDRKTKLGAPKNGGGQLDHMGHSMEVIYGGFQG